MSTDHKLVALLGRLIEVVPHVEVFVRPFVQRLLVLVTTFLTSTIRTYTFTDYQKLASKMLTHRFTDYIMYQKLITATF